MESALRESRLETYQDLNNIKLNKRGHKEETQGPSPKQRPTNANEVMTEVQPDGGTSAFSERRPSDAPRGGSSSGCLSGAGRGIKQETTQPSGRRSSCQANQGSMDAATWLHTSHTPTSALTHREALLKPVAPQEVPRSLQGPTHAGVYTDSSN